MNVCKGCPKRTIECHGTCEWYKAERKALDEHNRRIRAENIAKSDISGAWNYDKRGIKR